MNWTEKYRPDNFSGIKGQLEAVAKIKDFIGNFNLRKISGKKTQKKAMLLYGGPGVGKTTLAHTAAKESNAEIFELNASDLRNKSKLKETLKPAIEQRSLLKKNKIILIDEADGITGTDRGGVPEVVSLIESAEHPIILTANDAWTKKLQPLRKKCELIELKPLANLTTKEVLNEILRKEGKFINEEILADIILKSKGDLRAAINDVQAISRLSPEDQISTNLNERNKQTDIFNALKKIFKSKANNESLRVFDSVDLPLDEIILWMEKNIPKEYRNEELERAIGLLCETDLFKGRIYKQQYWRFLVYENIFMSYGISSLNKSEKNNFTRYEKPTRVLKIWMNNQKTAKKKTIAKKYAEYCHISIKRAMQEFPIISQVINSNPRISEELKLDEDEMVYLKN